MSDQYTRLVGNTLKHPYLVGISTESGNFGTGILISARFVLTCSHVLRDSATAEVISRDGSTTARVQKIDDSLDLALLELTRPISALNARFTDSALQPGAVLLAVGVQETPGQPDELSVAEIELKYRNKNDAAGKILDIQLEGGARPGYSGGPVVAMEGGILCCVGVMRFGGPAAGSSSAIGLASVRAFLADYIPDMQKERPGTKSDGLRRLLVPTAIIFGVFLAGAIAKWPYVTSHNLKGTNGIIILGTPEPEKTAIDKSAHESYPPTGPAKVPLVAKYMASHHTVAGIDRVAHGNPEVRVWVNTLSNVYHCPGTRNYGTTRHGEYMSQAEAQKKANRPAYGRTCK